MMDESEVVLALQNKLMVKSQKVVAQELGISTSYLNDILKMRRKISEKVGLMLGFEKVWRKIK